MRPILALFLLGAVTLAVSQEESSDAFNDKLNIIETKPSVRLDPYIRKALLKALSELEESNDQTTSYDVTDGTSTVNGEILNTNNYVKETETQTTTDGIQIHSFIVNGQAAFDGNSSNTTPTYGDEKISILTTSTGNVENQIYATLPSKTTFNEIFQTRESSNVNVQQVRSIPSASKSTADNEITSTSSKPTTTTKPKPPKTTTTTTTTTTTPKPTHNEDGENIEEVDQVQVFQAPLVAAFTVQQDAQGLPKKVIPHFQQTQQISHVTKPTTTVPTSVVPSVPSTSTSSVVTIPAISQSLTLPHVTKPSTDFVNQQLSLQRQLEEKQRILEDQLRILQQQQRQQEELLRKQQFLLQQKEAQRQQQLAFGHEQFKRQQLQGSPTVNNFQVQGLPRPIQPNPFSNQHHNFPPTQVSIQQSVPIENNLATHIPSHQQLPNREAVDFLLHLRNQQPGPFPLQENHLPQGISSFLQPTPVNNQFNQFSNFNQLRPVEDQFRQKHGNRVFRQEAGVGNFGLNNQNFNRFNSFNPNFNNQFFPPNRPNLFNHDLELKQLFAQNGLNGRNQEDLNIVSKVLSLNHGVGINNNISNRLPFDSRRQVRPF